MAQWDPAAQRITNAFFSTRLEPLHGGRLVSLATRRGELTTVANAADLAMARVPYRFGLLSVQLWQDSYWHNDLCHRQWPIVGTNVQDGQVAITLRGESLLWLGVAVTRTIEVADAPWIDVRHVLDPGMTSGPYLPPAFWFSNVMSGRGRSFLPTPAGVLAYPRWAQEQSWSHEPTDGWMAWIGGKVGLAVMTDPVHLRHVRLWHQRADRVEWIRRRVESVETTNVRLIPFHGLRNVDGVGPAGIVAVSTMAGHVVVDVYGLVSGPAELTLERVPGRGGVATARARLTAGQLTRFDRFSTGRRSGFIEIVAVHGVGTLTVNSGRGTATTTFALPAAAESDQLRGFVPIQPGVPELPRADAAHRQVPRSFAFDALPLPAAGSPWLKRGAGRLRVLALADALDTPPLLALASAFDLDLTLPFMPRGATLPTGSDGIAGQRLEYELGDRYETLFGDELIAAYRAALDASRSYDVILLGVNAGWAPLSQALQANILARVQAGTGLLSIRRGDPGGPNPEAAALAALLPLEIVSWSDARGAYIPVDDRTVRGLPWSTHAHTGWIIEHRLKAGAELLLEVMPIQNDPRYNRPLLARTRYGAGRVLDLVWGPYVLPRDSTRPRPAGTEGMDALRYDLAFLARLLFDAAGRSPEIAVRQVALAGNQASIELERVVPAVHAFELDWIARDRFGLVRGQGRLSPTTFPASAQVSVPLPDGTWIVDVVVQPAGGTPGWGAGSRTLDFGLAADPDLLTLGPENSLQLAPAAVPGATSYLVETVDGRTRIVARQSVAPGAAAAISAAPIETPNAEVRVHALDAAGRLLAQALRPLRVRMRTGSERWPIHFWGDAVGTSHPIVVRHLDALATVGINVHFRLPPGVSLADDLIRAADRLAVPYVVQASGWLYASGGQAPDGSGAPLSLTDGDAIAAGMAGDRSAAVALADANVLYYVLADDESDSPPTDVSHDPRTLERFRAALANVYGHSAANFRREWGPAAALATATPPSYADAVAAFNAGELSYAPWVDHRRFMMDLFSGIPALAREALRNVDPNALTGTSGDYWTAVAGARNWWVRGQALDIVGRYSVSTELELKALGKQSITWTGYDDPDPLIRHRVWTVLGLGGDGLALFTETTFVNPDLSLPEVGRDLVAALLPVRRGIGGLFASSAPADDRIHVFVSPASSAVLAIHGYESLGAWVAGTPPVQADLGTDAREGIHELLATLGVGWSAISPEAVETGALERNAARVLILPMCAGMSDEACEAIRRWVAQGGRVIADLLPGSFSAHGRLRATGIGANGAAQGSSNALDAVFGLVPGVRPTIAATTVTIGGAGAVSVRCVDKGAVPGASAASAGVEASGAPVWFSARYQRGSACYLGCSWFSDYRSASGSPTSDEAVRMEQAFAELLSSLGVPARAWVVDANDRRVPFCQVRVRKLGPAELVVLLRSYSGIYAPVAPEVDAELHFQAPAHTYDLENGVYLGHGDRLALRVSAYTFRAFTRLPYLVRRIDATIVGAPHLGDVITVNAAVVTDSSEPGPHRLRFDVLDGQRQALRYLAREAITECGRATAAIPSAHNDPPGTWTIVVADVMTGVQCQITLDMGAVSGPAPQPVPLHWDAIDD